MPSVNVSFVRCLKERDIDLIQVSLKDGASAEQLDAYVLALHTYVYGFILMVFVVPRSK